MLKLLGRTSSINVRKVLWTLREIDVPFVHEDDWGGDFRSTQSDAFLKLNPNGLVPVLVDETGVWTESNTICRYLAGKYERHDLLPVAPQERAEIERWMDWVSEYNIAYRYGFMALSRKHPRYTLQSEIDFSVERWNQMTVILDKALSGSGPFIGGDVFSLADIALGLSVNRWLKTPMKRADCPAVVAYHGRLLKREAFVGFGYDVEA